MVSEVLFVEVKNGCQPVVEGFLSCFSRVV